MIDSFLFAEALDHSRNISALIGIKTVPPTNGPRAKARLGLYIINRKLM
jgi:hypothetical protein